MVHTYSPPGDIAPILPCRLLWDRPRDPKTQALLPPSKYLVRPFPASRIPIENAKDREFEEELKERHKRIRVA